MKKRFISTYIVMILVFSIYGCAQTAENAPAVEPKTAETGHTETENEEETESDTEDIETIAAEEDSAQFYHTEFRELVIEEGLMYQGRILLDIQGDEEPSSILSSQDAAAYAEKIGQELIESLETGTLPNRECEQLEENWTANPYYDCYYVDMTDTECIGFLYHIYPDYDRMGIETAGAVTYRYNVDIHTGKPVDTAMEVYPMTREEYQAEMEWMGEKYQVIRGGWIYAGSDGVILDLLGSLYAIEDFGQWFWDDLQADGLQNGKISERLAGVESLQLARIDDAVRKKQEEGWNLEKYDGYYLENDVREDWVHCQYYFYLEKPGEEARTVIVMDTLMSKDGIEDIQYSTFKTYWSIEKEVKPVNAGNKYKRDDIAAFFTYDWTSHEVLMEHDIQPQESGRGWEFSVADVDFDGIPEMLVHFPTYHNEYSSVYIYKQKNGSFFSYTDTIAAGGYYIHSGIDYKLISPYMDIDDLFCVYQNADHKYRYLSLDYNLHGGDRHGDMGSVSLYETILGEKTMPRELVRIEYCCPDEITEMYFCGEKVYEAGKLRDKIADYMTGYTEVEMPRTVVEKSFVRDIVGFDEADLKAELEELYQALEKLIEE